MKIIIEVQNDTSEIDALLFAISKLVDVGYYRAPYFGIPATYTGDCSYGLYLLYITNRGNINITIADEACWLDA